MFAAPDRHLVFDLNDLTRRCAAPFEWAVKRLVASFVVGARDNGHRRNEQRAAARAAVRIKQQPSVIVRPPEEKYGDFGQLSGRCHLRRRSAVRGE